MKEHAAALRGAGCAGTAPGQGLFSPVSSLFFFLLYLPGTEEPKLLPADHMLVRPSAPGMLVEARQGDVSSLPAPATGFKRTTGQLNLPLV